VRCQAGPIISLTRFASVSMETGFVSTYMPLAGCPWFTMAFSAQPVTKNTLMSDAAGDGLGCLELGQIPLLSGQFILHHARPQNRDIFTPIGREGELFRPVRCQFSGHKLAASQTERPVVVSILHDGDHDV